MKPSGSKNDDLDINSLLFWPVLQERSSQKPPNGSAEPDDSLAISPDENQNEANLLRKSALPMTVGILAPYLGFCWWLMLMSFLVTYYYTLWVIRSFRPARTSLFSYDMTKFATQSVFKLLLLAGMFAWCISITPIHIFVPTAMDFWTPYEVHEPLRMTEIVYDPGQSANIDIFAIHGLGSRPESAWTHRANETKVRWLSELLPQTKGFQDMRIVLVNHQTRWDSNTAYMELNDYASELLGHIESQHKANPDRPIIFIAHSFGGLLLKKALLLAKSRSREVAAMTKGIIFLGVPHRGTNAALLATCLSCMAFFRGSSSNLLEFMSVDSPSILELESEFYDAYVLPYHPYEPQPYICDVLEMRPERMGKLVLGSIVRPKHGLLRHGRVFTLDTDHRGLNKFHSYDDPNFHIFLRILLQARTYALQPNPFMDLAVPGSHYPQSEVPVKPLDPLDFASYSMPWMTNKKLAALALGGLEEYAASFLANDISTHGYYFTRRVPKTAFYKCLIGVSISQALDWLVFKFFEGYTSLETQMLQIVISKITIVPIQTAFDHIALAYIAGARNYNQFRATVKVGLIPALKLSLAFSPICILVAHFFLLPQSWAVFFHAGNFFLTTYINASVKMKRLEALRKRDNMRRYAKQQEVGSKDSATGEYKTPTIPQAGGNGELENEEDRSVPGKGPDKMED